MDAGLQLYQIRKLVRDAKAGCRYVFFCGSLFFLCRVCALIAGFADSGHSGQVANPLSIEEDDGFDECKLTIVWCLSLFLISVTPFRSGRVLQSSFPSTTRDCSGRT